MNRSDTAPAVAIESAEAWLALLDGGSYSRAWEDAAASMQACISQADFDKRMQSDRGPLGKVESRAFKTQRHLRGISVSRNEITIISYITTFENKPNVAEGIVLAREQDGKWRVDGYTLP